VNQLRFCTGVADSAIQRGRGDRLPCPRGLSPLLPSVRSGQVRPSPFRGSGRRHRLALLRAASLALRRRQDRDFASTFEALTTEDRPASRLSRPRRCQRKMWIASRLICASRSRISLVGFRCLGRRQV